MFIAGIVLAVLGGISAIIGFVQNNSLEAQVASMFTRGVVNPGTTWIIIGVIAVVIGIVLMVLGRKKSA
ncbi:MAG: DUF3185 family protein [Christensenellales bacterium]|jgi:uncharacterized membrane protein YidH (DUF202 family)